MLIDNCTWKCFYIWIEASPRNNFIQWNRSLFRWLLQFSAERACMSSAWSFAPRRRNYRSILTTRCWDIGICSIVKSRFRRSSMALKTVLLESKRAWLQNGNLLSGEFKFEIFWIFWGIYNKVIAIIKKYLKPFGI